jgi:hypothetical protein
MDLMKRFVMVGCVRAVSIAELKTNTPYWITKAVWSNTKFGQAILIAIKDDCNRLSCVFLPTKYLCVFTVDDIKLVTEKQNYKQFTVGGVRRQDLSLCR